MRNCFFSFSCRHDCTDPLAQLYHSQWSSLSLRSWVWHICRLIIKNRLICTVNCHFIKNEAQTLRRWLQLRMVSCIVFHRRTRLSSEPPTRRYLSSSLCKSLWLCVNFETHCFVKSDVYFCTVMTSSTTMLWFDSACLWRVLRTWILWRGTVRGALRTTYAQINTWKLLKPALPAPCA